MFRDMNGKEDIRLDSIKEYVTGSGDSLKMNEGCLAGEMLENVDRHIQEVEEKLIPAVSISY